MTGDPILAGTLQLGDVRDVERLCEYVATIERCTDQLNSQEWDELLGWMIATTYELWLRYDPERDRATDKGRRPSFQSYAVYVLRLRTRRYAGQLRTRTSNGRTVSLDAIFEGWDDTHPDDPANVSDPGIRRLVESFASSELDPAQRGDPTIQRLYESRNSGALRENDPLDDLDAE